MGNLLIIKPERLAVQFRNPIVQYFYAASGFGCKPENGDKKVFGCYLADGMRDQLYRSDFLGIADSEQLPKWARNRLENLQTPKMKIRIFQLKDNNDNLFMSHDNTISHGGIRSEDYRQVYGGQVSADGLEDVFALCNSDKMPPGYCGRSLSVSDVIEICEGRNKGFYFCDSFGFQKLDDFDIEKTDHKDMLKILVLENDKPPYAAEIRHDIHAMQNVVGGSIEAVYFESESDALCWCNDEFLLNGSTPNRKIGDVLVHGTCYICGDGINADGEYDSCSLTEEQIEKYTRMFPQSVIMLEKQNEDMTDCEDIDIKL